jgi:hypothetical protein
MPFTGRHPRTNLPYEPELADLEDFPNPRHTGLAQEPWRPGQPRPDFYESTINQVFADAPQEWVTDPRGRRVLHYECAETGQWGPYDAFQVDHDMKWENFLEAVGPETRADAAMAYNDLSNLHIMMAPANAAGDHNRPDNDGDDGSDVGSDGNIRDLIDDDEAEEEIPAEARRGLDDFVGDQLDPANRIRFEDIEAGRRRPRESDIDPDEEEDEDDAAGDLADDARSGPRHKRQRLRAEQDDDEQEDDSGDEADDEDGDEDGDGDEAAESDADTVYDPGLHPPAAADAAEADAAADAAGSASARGAQAARGASAAGDAAEAGEAADALGALEEIGELALVALL